MLADRRSAALVNNFAAQWLRLRNLDGATPDMLRPPTPGPQPGLVGGSRPPFPGLQATNIPSPPDPRPKGSSVVF